MFIILVIHSNRTFGPRATVNFFGIGFIWTFLREWFYQNYLHFYDYESQLIQFLNVPILAPVVWTSASYISLIIAEQLSGISLSKLIPLKGEKIDQKVFEAKYFHVLVIALIVQSAISFSIETLALNMGWWTIHGFPPTIASLRLPFEGWPFTILITLNLFFILTYPQFRSKKNLLFFICAFISIFYVNYMVYVFLPTLQNTTKIVLLELTLVPFYLVLALSYWEYFLYLVCINPFGGPFFTDFVVNNSLNLGIDMFSRQLLITIIGFMVNMLLLIYFLKTTNWVWAKRLHWFFIPWPLKNRV